jgi:hypothetical protein
MNSKDVISDRSTPHYIQRTLELRTEEWRVTVSTRWHCFLQMLTIIKRGGSNESSPGSRIVMAIKTSTSIECTRDILTLVAGS